MLEIQYLYLDGTRLGSLLSIAEFSAVHPVSRFSWAICSDIPDGVQTRFRLTLSRKSDGTVLFDSGLRETDDRYCDVPGANLIGETYIDVTVTVSDSNGRESPAYTATVFNGSLPAFPGTWISSERDEGDRVLRFVRTFEVNKTVSSAVLYCCGLGYHQPTVNGQSPLECAYLDPAHSNYAKTCYYRVYSDVVDLLSDGVNYLDIAVAPGWRKNRSDFMTAMLGERKVEFAGDSVLWACLRIRYEDGQTEDIATDDSWLCGTDPRTASIFCGETYDARLECPIEEMARTAARTVEGPGGILRPMTLQPITVGTENLPVVEITAPKPGMFVVDFGKNIAGVAELRIPTGLEAGHKIVLRFAEELNEDGTLFTEPLRAAWQTDTYIASGKEDEYRFWSSDFTYHGFRYCEVTGLDRLDRGDIYAIDLHTNLEKHSSFSCGSAVLNAIQENLIRTERNNMHSILTDCPQRDERMGWMNDATVRFEETPYNFDVSRMFPKILDDIHNEQRPEGQFTCCCPFVFGGLPADPVCSSYLMAAKQALMHCGEIHAVEEYFDGMAAWEDFLLSRSPDGCVDYTYYGDWAAPGYACLGGENGHAGNLETPGLLMSTGYSYFNCVTLADFARRLGRESDAEKYEKAAEYVRAAFLKKWYDPETAKVAKGSMGSQAFALWLGILPEEDRNRAAKVMRDDLVGRDYMFTTGNLCTRYLVDMLTAYGYVNEAYTLLTKDTYPGYGYMIQNEATTIWERFELKKDPGMNSHNHPMYGAVGSYFYQYLAGITPTEPGFKRVTVKPYYPDKLLSCHAVVDTVAGELSVRWHKRYGSLYLFVSIPFGTTADVFFDGEKHTVTGGYHVFQKKLTE